MKRINIFSIIMIILLLTFAGCNSETNKDIFLNDEDIHTDYAGVHLTLESVEDNEENKKLNVVWHNETETEVTYGKGYNIEIKTEIGWESVLTSELIVPSIGIILKADGENNEFYSTENFDVSEEGVYRLRCEFYVGDGNRYNTWVEFEIKAVGDN